jgi:hypothetical protein
VLDVIEDDRLALPERAGVLTVADWVVADSGVSIIWELLRSCEGKREVSEKGKI